MYTYIYIYIYIYSNFPPTSHKNWHEPADSCVLHSYVRSTAGAFCSTSFLQTVNSCSSIDAR